MNGIDRIFEYETEARKLRRDVIATGADMRLVTAVNNATGELVTKIQHGTSAHVWAEVTSHAHRQISQWTQVPGNYYDRMLHADPELLCSNVNHWFRRRGGERRWLRLERMARGGEKLRAFMTDREDPVSYLDAVKMITDVATELGVWVISVANDGARLYVRLLSQRGQLTFSCSDVGRGRPLVENVSRAVSLRLAAGANLRDSRQWLLDSVRTASESSAA